MANVGEGEEKKARADRKVEETLYSINKKVPETNPLGYTFRAMLLYSTVIYENLFSVLPLYKLRYLHAIYVTTSKRKLSGVDAPSLFSMFLDTFLFLFFRFLCREFFNGIIIQSFTNDVHIYSMGKLNNN